MNERQLIAWVRSMAGTRSGIGDDCAILRVKGSSSDLLVTTDQLVEGIHFSKDTHTAAEAGRKALARNLSDIAAMGGMPRWCFVSMTTAAWTTPRWIRGFYHGLLRLARQTRTQLAGGDLGRASGFYCDVVVIGQTQRGKAIQRSTAQPGDAIYVSGVLGGSALGLETGKGLAWKRHRNPEPRLGLGRYLRGRASACMDLSDGLSVDLCRLCIESGVRAVVDRPLPVFHGATLEHALHGGEDYELLFTVPATRRIPSHWRGLALTRIGTLASGRPGAVEFFGRPLKALGYDHFTRK
jgi:thiamine-monophosphate kinase